MGDNSARFWMLLARTLGMTVAEAMERIDSAEFTSWMAEYEISPWGEMRSDIQSANIARFAVMAQSGREVSQWAFMPQLAFPTDTQEQSPDEMRSTMAMMAHGEGK
jgi:hypothetical protein